MMGFGIAVLRWQISMMEFGIAVLPWQCLMMAFEIAVLPWQLLLIEFGMILSSWHFVMSCSGPETYRAPNKGAACCIWWYSLGLNAGILVVPA